MFKPGDVISYLDMCKAEDVNLQRGMNFHLHPKYSVILMSLRPNAPYADKVENDGRVLIYEGHDEPKTSPRLNPKSIDQPMKTPGGSLTQNGLFFKAAQEFKQGNRPAEEVKVYEKIRSGIWVYSGTFELIDAWLKSENFSDNPKESRRVFKFRLELSCRDFTNKKGVSEIERNRLIPSSVKLEVWRRDGGKCVKCGSKINLHLDHIIPYSKGGSSSIADNIQILCSKHNIAKKDNIE